MRARTLRNKDKDLKNRNLTTLIQLTVRMKKSWYRSLPPQQILLLNKLLKYMGEEACIDDDLYNKIYDGMLERLKDRVAEIRSQAVTALQRLQDPKDEECPIIKAYLFHLAHDPNNVVRRTIVRCIGATRLTLPHILERTRDTDEHVRRAAYKFLAEKVHIKSLTIGQREGLLQRGLGERSEAVR